jgi:hypothetical protein
MFKGSIKLGVLALVSKQANDWSGISNIKFPKDGFFLQVTILLYQDFHQLKR